MKRPVLRALEAAAILLVVPLGAIWPGLLTIVAFAVLPAFFMAVSWAVKPLLFSSRDLQDPRRGFRRYIHVSAIASVASVLLQTAWLVVNHSTPADIIVAEGAPRVVRVVFGVENGEPLIEREGRRVFHIPQSGVLLTRAQRDGGWWRDDERRFFVETPEMLVPVSGQVGAAGAGTVGVCAAPFQEYIVNITKASDRDAAYAMADPSLWGIDCRGDRLTRR
jgi:hypothetical protein